MSIRSITALGLGLAACGVVFSSPSLTVAGLGLAVLTLASLAWVALAARGAGLVFESGPARVVEGDPYELRLRLRRRVPPPGGELEEPLLGRPLPVGPLRPRRVTAEIRLPRRGRHRLDRAAWIIRDPLAICERRIAAAPAGELLVLPRIEPIEIDGDRGGRGALAATELGLAAGAAVREARAVEFEIDGLRPHTPGAPASRIHWPAVARSGELYERRLVAGADELPLVVLDAERPDSEEALDRAVRAAASLCVHLGQGPGCSLLLPGRREPRALDRTLHGWAALHAELAVVRAGARTAALPRDGGHGTVFWVSGGAVDRLLARARARGRGRQFAVTARRVEAARVAFRVAGCTGFALAGATRSAGRRRAGWAA